MISNESLSSKSSSPHCPQHRLPQTTNCATCQAAVDEGGGELGDDNFKDHQSGNHNHHLHSQSSRLSSLFTSFFRSTFFQSSTVNMNQRATSTYLQNSSSFSTNRKRKHSFNLHLLSSSTSDLLSHLFLLHWLPRLCLYLLTVWVSV